MEIFKRIFLGWKMLFDLIISAIKVEDLIYLLPMSIGLVLFLKVFFERIKYIHIKSQFTIKKNKSGLLNNITKLLMKNKRFSKIVKELAVKIGMYNKLTYEKNIEAAVFLLICISGITFMEMVYLVTTNKILWYISIAYLVLTLFFIWLVFYVFNMMAKIRFTSKLPETFKIVNSRYISKGNILKALRISMDDFDGAIKKEMMKIYNVLKKNDMKEIDETFKSIEVNYKNNYLTLLLNLIKQAHFKGGNEIIKQQFEQATEEVLLDIENHKDLTSTSRAYILLAMSMPLALIGIEIFNNKALGESAANFYESTVGIELKILTFIILIIYIGFMLLLERKW